MELKALRYEVAERVAIVTLHRPDRLNAWTGRMHHEYRWCLHEADTDPGVRAVVVTGAGRGFCAGADTAALEGHSRRGGYDSGLPEEVPNPGFGIDERFEADFAKLTTAHGRLNLPAEFGLSWLLPRLIGVGRAMDLLLSSRVILAEEALQWGLVNRVVPAEEVLAESLSWARSLADEVAPHSLAATRQQVWLDQHRDVRSAVLHAGSLLEEMMTEPDFQRGVQALVERRSPGW